MQTPNSETQTQTVDAAAKQQKSTPVNRQAPAKPAPAKSAAKDRPPVKGDKPNIGKGVPKESKPQKEEKAPSGKSQAKAPALFPTPVTGGQVEIFILFCAKRDKDASVNRRRESLASMQEQLYLGSCVGRDAKIKLMEAKAAFAKTHPDYYFWISSKKAWGTLPANLEMAVALENVINSFKK